MQQLLADVSHHADELDQLQSHGDHHSLAEVVDRSDHLVVAGEQVHHQSALVLRAQRQTCGTHAGARRCARSITLSRPFIFKFLFGRGHFLRVTAAS